MCGFSGYLGHVDAPDRTLEAMADAIAHRGPDGRGFYHVEPNGRNPGVGLAHVRLAIIDPADSLQPMLSADSTLALAFNGEIFNYTELRQDLIARGHVFRTSGDTEVLLRLYEEMGEACLSRLNGDFAFAIWDDRRKCLFLARDRMGVRPLFYTRHGGTFYFASEAKALLTVPGLGRGLDLVALDQIFTLWSPVGQRTAFSGISELEPGTYMFADASGERLATYWRLDFPDAKDAFEGCGDEDASLEQLNDLLVDATRIRLRADVPVGACLSGGLDSSLVAALAAEHAPQGLRTFSIAFGTPEHDESHFQQEMARHLGVSNDTVCCSTGDIAAAFPQVIRLAEKPLVRTAPAPMLRLSSLVRESGIKVVLTGEGADEVFAGYDIFKEARVRRFCARDPGSRLRPLLFRRLYPYLPGLQKQSAASLAAFFGAHATAFDDPLFSHRPRMANTAGAKLFFSDDLKSTLGAYDAAEDLISLLPERFSRWHPLHQAQYLESRFLLPGYILSSQGDRMAMGNGIEGRFPFLDHRLVEFAAKLPPELKLRGLEEKHILRKAARQRLPASIINRVKQPYRAPDSKAFHGNTESDYVRRLFDPARLKAQGLFNPSSTGKLYEKCAVSEVPGFRADTAFVGILSTGLWLETFNATSQPAAAGLAA